METDDERQARADEQKYGQLYDELAGRYWHCTSWRGLRSIVERGSILPNAGQFKISSGCTSVSYCFREGFIAVFDFVEPTRCDALYQAWKWSGFFSIWEPVTIALELSAAWVKSEGRLIRASEAEAEPFETAYRYPVVEAWVRQPIPFGVVESVRLMCRSGPGLLAVTIDRPLILDRIDDARVDLVQRYRRERRQRSPDGGLYLLALRAERLRRRKPPT